MEGEHGGNDGGPNELTVDAQIEAEQQRINELSQDGRISRADAVWQVRNEANAEVVKENAQAQAQAQVRSAGQAPDVRASQPEPEVQAQEPAGPSDHAGADYSYALNGMARHRSDGLHHMPEGPGRQSEGPDQDRAAEQAGPEHGSDQPEPAQVRSEAGRESASYRDMMRDSQARQMANRTQDHDHSRG